jgi:hypothetical protein
MLQARRAMELNCDLPETYIYLLGTDWITFSGAYELNTRWLEEPSRRRAVPGFSSDPFCGMISEDEAAEPRDELLRSRRAIAGADGQRGFSAVSPESGTAGLLSSPSVHRRRRPARGRVAGSGPAAALEDNRFWRFKGWLDAATGEYETAKPPTNRRCAETRSIGAASTSWRMCCDGSASTIRSTNGRNWPWKAEPCGEKCMELPDVQSAPITMMTRIAQYARDCGDNRFANCLEYRLPLNRATMQSRR